MKTNLKDKTCVVYDKGLFFEVALRLARDFGCVYYFCEAFNDPFPKSNIDYIGKGYNNVIRIDKFWPIVEQADNDWVFFFPDIISTDVQEKLDKEGYSVVGSQSGVKYEFDRILTKEKLEQYGLDVPERERIIGIDALREYLQKECPCFIKPDKYRGDIETFFAENYELVLPKIDKLEHSLGYKAKEYSFIVEKPIDNAQEVGYDGYTANGQWPNYAINGVEVKDCAYVCKILPMPKMDTRITEVLTKFSKDFKKCDYANFISSETRIVKEKSFMIDWCCRLGNPPSNLYMEMYINFSEIVWELGQRKVIDPVFKYKYGVEIKIWSNWAYKEWLAITIDEKYRDKVKILNCYKDIEGKEFVIPQDIEQVGSVIGLGNTIEEAINDAKKIAKHVKGTDIKIKVDALDEAIKVLTEAKKNGINLL